LEVDFNEGLSAITGETGAGKSILMGALGLVLGARADSTALRDKSKKCVIEAGFKLSGLTFEKFFATEDLDYEEKSLIRRELLPGGKSRAFVNDTPVTLPVLKKLGDKLVNIHAQHHNLMLREEGFPLEVVDAFGGLEGLKSNYQDTYNRYKILQADIKKLDNDLQAAQKEQDYLEFQYNQLNDAGLISGEEDKLVEEQEILSHAEEIRISLSTVTNSISVDEINVLQLLNKSLQEINTIKKYYPDLEDSNKRLDSVLIEVKDLSEELERMLGGIEYDPERLKQLTERLDLLYSLQKKHQVNSNQELIDVREGISSKLEEITTSDIELNKLNSELIIVLDQLNGMAEKLRKKRLKGLSSLSDSVVDHLKDVGMPNARFEVRHTALDDFTEEGKDKFSFFFSANKNQELELIQRVASGVEISRLMLSIKSLISESLAVPTLIFDEIDAGVSGEIADKMGKMLRRISKNRQVINVTHLPQVAGRGDYHYQVYKYDDGSSTRTDIRLLDEEGRIMEMAKMLSGEQLTKEALGNAKALLHKS
jgi:DNA repair protein RecN (Recombination protein N)